MLRPGRTDLMGDVMRKSIVKVFAVAALLGAAAPAIAGDQFALLKPVTKMTPRDTVQPAACTFTQCNCRSECVVYQGDHCVRSVRTCDVCSKCND